MATATKPKKDKTVTETLAADAKPSLFKQGVTKADGTPWNHGAKRSSEELVKEYEEKLAKFKDSAAATVARYEKLIAYHKNGGAGPTKVDPEKAKAAAVELLAGGMTPDEIVAMEAKLRAAKAALKGKTSEEIEALQAEAKSLPSFITGVEAPVAPAEEPEEEDEEDEE